MSGPRWWMWLAGLLAGLIAGLYLIRWWQRRCREADSQTCQPVTITLDALSGQAAPASEPDDLQRIEGIGPKISRLLSEAGIASFADLASAEVSRLKTLLEEANIRLADPATWPEQARLAAAGRWEELSALQSRLKGGRRQGR